MKLHVVGIIPARGGSKGIPRKNLVAVGGKPLIAYTCEAARQSRMLSRVVLSTDDEEVAQVAGQYGVEAPFRRPDTLASDEMPMLPVMQHAVREIERDGRPVDIVVLLQPTSPLRRASHIDASVSLLLDSEADSVVSVIEVPHQYHPWSVLRLEGGRLIPFLEGPTVTRRQDKPLMLARNGPAVVAVRRAVLMDGNSLYGTDSRPFMMGREESLDVDGPWDLKLLDFLLVSRSTASPGLGQD